MIDIDEELKTSLCMFLYFHNCCLNTKTETFWLLSCLPSTMTFATWATVLSWMDITVQVTALKFKRNILDSSVVLRWWKQTILDLRHIDVNV